MTISYETFPSSASCLFCGSASFQMDFDLLLGLGEEYISVLSGVSSPLLDIKPSRRFCYLAIPVFSLAGLSLLRQVGLLTIT